MLNRIVRTIEIPRQTVDMHNRLMAAAHVDYKAHGIQKYSTVKQWTATFDNGFEMDLKVCSCGPPSPLWCEAVLFENGRERTCSEVEVELDGTWQLECDDTVYVLEVTGV